MDANELAAQVAHHMLAAEGTGPAWDLKIEEVREDYARVSMVVRADMLNGHGFAHGGMIFALADSAFAYVCQWRQPREHGGAGLHRLPRQGARGRDPRCRSHRSRARRRADVTPVCQRPVTGARSQNLPAIRARLAERSWIFERYAPKATSHAMYTTELKDGQH